MSKTDAILYIKDSNVEDVVYCLSSLLQTSFNESSVAAVGGVLVRVIDVTYEVNYALDFIEERKLYNNLDEFNRVLEKRKFTTSIFINVRDSSVFKHSWKSMSNELSKALSAALKTQVMLYWASEVPIRAYENGEILIDLIPNIFPEDH